MPSSLMPMLPLVYPDSDGKPMAENTLQYQWIVLIRENLDVQYVDRGDVLVAADNLIYPVRANPRLCTAPDVYVAFGRPPGHRGSYKLWEEADIFPQVIFEVLSPGNTVQEMTRKRRFYRRFGAEEYYVINPDTGQVDIRVRNGRRFVRVREEYEFVSPRLGIRFQRNGAGELSVLRADGSPFLLLRELERLRAEVQQRADDEMKRADDEMKRADREKRRADVEKARAEKLAAKMRELGLDPDAV